MLRASRLPARMVLAVAVTTSALLVGPTVAHASTGFTSSGNAIYDPGGSAFTMRGVNIILAETAEQMFPFSADQLAELQRWHINTVRIELGESYWIGSDAGTQHCSLYDGYKTLVDGWVAGLTSAHILALIDLHTSTTDGSVVCSDAQDAHARRQTADHALAPTFWSEVAGRYGSGTGTVGDSAYVAFELYNEPQCLTVDQWLNDRPVPVDSCNNDIPAPTNPPTFAGAGMQTLYNVVRGTGSQNLVVVDGVNDKSLLPGHPPMTAGGYDVTYALTNPIAGVNVAYASHPYFSNDCGSLPPDIDQKVAAVAATVPVVFTEFGSACRNAKLAANFNSQVLSYAQQHAMGWAAFAWGKYFCSLTGPCSFGLVTSMDARPYQPSVPGQPVYDALGPH